MAGMGPAPKPEGQRRRSNATVGMTELPAEGRKGQAPAWPLPPDVRRQAAIDQLHDKAEGLAMDAQGKGPEARAARTRLLALRERIDVMTSMLDASKGRELELWAKLWATPQAVAWERLRWENDVATYVRWTAQAEMGDLESGREARQWSDRLGLNPLALLRLRWRISTDEVGEHRETRARTTRSTATSRARRGLKAVDGAS